jgi:hypothetical protein
MVNGKANERKTLGCPLVCRLGGVVVSVLAAGTKGRGLKPGRGDGFFKGDKNPQHAFLRMESTVGSPM